MKSRQCFQRVVPGAGHWAFSPLCPPQLCCRINSPPRSAPACAVCSACDPLVSRWPQSAPGDGGGRLSAAHVHGLAAEDGERGVTPGRSPGKVWQLLPAPYGEAPHLPRHQSGCRRAASSFVGCGLDGGSRCGSSASKQCGPHRNSPDACSLMPRGHAQESEFSPGLRCCGLRLQARQG